ncbi:RNA-directed DNA polymerase, eukaryota [Tanacetum coccineum]
MNSSQDNQWTQNKNFLSQNVVKSGGSVLDVMEDIIRVGQVMGYSMEGCVKDLENIIGKQGEDNLFMERGFLTNSKILFIAIYAPQQTSCKRKLWDYISNIVGRWNGESIIMGDFNEVRSSEERRGSCFNPYSARYFDRFISNAGLVDVTLEGYAFTWAHPSASKMSKLDRFLVSDGIFSLFPSITAICLDRHLSDHRPILLREVKLDFGPTPFRFYHSWFDYVGFDDMIKLSWHSWPRLFLMKFSLSGKDKISKKAMFFKVDFAKAYDSVRWDYLLEVLEAFGFGRTWCNWIRGTLTSAKASILINGSPSKEYSCHRGLKQGDPLAPYLFILIMESLHLSFNRVVDEGLFKGIQLPGSLSLSHLFYADDAMFIGEWSNENLSGIINILKSFFLASGLQINILKSQLLGVCVPHQVVEQAASLIGCSIMSNKFRYLGVMVGEYSSRIKAWDDVILKLRSRLISEVENPFR